MAEPARPLAQLHFLSEGPAPSASAADQKRAFLRLMSHELRTPLNSILGFSEILASELYGPLGAPQYKEYAQIVRQSGEKLLGLVNQLLELARLESGVSDLVVGPEPLPPLLEDVLEPLGSAADRVRLVQPDSALSVLADPRGLRTVLGNLIGNALLASPPGAEVRVEVQRSDSDVTIAVSDGGEMVDADDLRGLLRPFEQTGAGDGGPGRGGASLCLPSAALLCRAMGGKLSLSSAPGAGLTALVRLPAA